MGGSGAVEFGEGEYEVSFDRDVTACTCQATSSEEPGALLAVGPRFAKPDSVFVEVSKVYDGPLVVGSFDLAVFC